MKKIKNYFIKFYIIFSFLCGLAYSEEKPYSLNELKSGSHFSRQETRDIENDEFSNPGMIWVEKGEELFNLIDGSKNISCNNCHDQSGVSLVGVAINYPKVDREKRKLINLEQKINFCRTEKMNAESFQFESDSLLSLTSYITYLSKDMAINVKIEGDAKKYFLKGKELYYQRVGQMNLACNQCHDEIAGSYLRSEKISQGHVNGFPSYLMRWDSIASVHRRFQFCNNQARAEPLEIGHPDYNALQLYVTWRGNSLLIESPSVRR